MELTPKLLETQHFPERFRGYDPDAVDDFLERVAAGLGEMQARLDDVADRIIDAETRTSSNGEDGEVHVHDGRRSAVESIKEALETAPRLEPATTASAGEAPNQGSVAIGATKIEIDRIAQLISLAQETADDVVEDAIVAAREQIADLLADVLVASSSELAATGAMERKAELESELLELDARISARRNDADQLADLIETRRRALGEIARDLSGRPDGPPDQHPATSTIEGVAIIDGPTTTVPDAAATQRPAREIRSGDDIEDPFFSALQRRESLEGE
ncbi:MAG: DivIVA domain-containing protein [Acidimicrobiales bacterium]|nr:MAG: DivIVA domain-containing protein [Acidimicrobiales bacterium]